jgi:hypothetical protein
MTQPAIAEICNTTKQYVGQILKRINAPEVNSLPRGHLCDNDEMTDVERKIAAVYEAEPSLPYRQVAELAGVSPKSVERYRQEEVSMATPRSAKPDEHEDRDRPQLAWPVPFPCEALLTRRDIAALLRITTRTLDTMISSGQYPRCDLRLPDPEKGDPRWRVATHDAWIRERVGVAETTAEPGSGTEDRCPNRSP